jgi:hypothetical protein
MIKIWINSDLITLSKDINQLPLFSKIKLNNSIYIHILESYLFNINIYILIIFNKRDP